MSMRLRAVVFDVGGVLLTLGEATYRQAVATGCGLAAVPPEYAAMIPAIQRGELPEAELWQGFAQRPIAASAFDQPWLQYYRPIPEMIGLAAELRAKDLRTAILSNTQPSHVRLMQSMGFLADFDPVVFSCEVRCRKPEPQIFSLVLDQLALPAGAVAFVDDLATNVEAAREQGLRGVLHAGDRDATRRTLLAMMD